MELTIEDYKKLKQQYKQKYTTAFDIGKYKQKRTMGNIRIVFTHSNSKDGKEEIYQYNKSKEQYYKCYIQDLFNEERSRYKDKELQELLEVPTIIGTMLVNLLNRKEQILAATKQCIDKIDKLKENDVTSIIEVILYLRKYIAKLLDKYSFVLTNYIDNFIYELVNIIEISHIDIYKQYKYLVLNTTTSNTFYKRLYNYFNECNEEIEMYYKNDFTVNTIATMFLESIIQDFIEISLYIDIDRNYISNKEINKQTKQYNIKENNLIIELPRVHIESASLGTKPTIYTYNISSLREFLNVCIYHINMNERVVSVCKNCKRFFISDVRNTEKYCKRISPTSKTNKRCCELWQYRFSNTDTNTEIKKLYKKLYDRLNNNAKYKEEWKTFKTDYDNYINELKNNNYDNEIYESKLYEWLENRDKELQEKYPSNRYGRKTGAYHIEKKINPKEFEE